MLSLMTAAALFVSAQVGHVQTVHVASQPHVQVASQVYQPRSNVSLMACPAGADSKDAGCKNGVQTAAPNGYLAQSNSGGDLSKLGTGLKNVIGAAQGIVSTLLAGLFILFMLIAGIRYIVASGSARRVDAARTSVTHCIEGAVIALLALVIWQVIEFIVTGIGA